MSLDRAETIARLKSMHDVTTATLNNESADRQHVIESLDLGLATLVKELTETEDVVIDLAFVLQLGAPVDRAACVICGLCTRSECGFHPAPQQRCEGHETPDPNPMPPAYCRLCGKDLNFNPGPQKYADAMTGSLYCVDTGAYHDARR